MARPLAKRALLRRQEPPRGRSRPSPGLTLPAILAMLAVSPAQARDAVYASAPQKVSVTVYRDPGRSAEQRIDADWPEGFAVISETRRVTLPPGESTIRFEGVSEGMVAVSAIVTGLPGGTIEKNRNAALLSPASLVDGTLGNRVTITRTNPATGAAVSENAIVRTRADGGLVLQTGTGYEAVRCAGLPETLSFDRVPDGLSAQPVFSVDTRDAAGGTYEVKLTYISWGFDWQAHYVATHTGEKPGEEKLNMLSWLTLVNSNAQTFAGAQLLVVAGRLNVESDFQDLADPPEGRPLSLTCYPIGSTAAGSPVPYYGPPPPLPPPPGSAADGIVVTAQYRAAPMMDVPLAMAAVSEEAMAQEEELGDLKLYRVPMAADVAANSIKQVAFLQRDKVTGVFQHRRACSPWNDDSGAVPMQLWFRTKNDDQHGLGVALPMGGLSLFEPSSAGDLLVAEPSLRDYAEGQDVDLELGESPTVFAQCVDDGNVGNSSSSLAWRARHVELSNANTHPVAVRIELGSSGDWKVRGKIKGLAVRDGQWSIERTIPAGKTERIDWQIRDSDAEDE